LPLRPPDHDDAARVAISWLAERHRKRWREDKAVTPAWVTHRQLPSA
jgi:hypothetical protein